MSINAVSISGNIGQEPEMMATTSGTSVMSFSVAVNERRQNAQGEWEDRVNWVGCTIFGKRAEGLAPHLHKGMKVSIGGKLRQDRWEDKDGNRRSNLGVIVDEIEFMTPREQPAKYAQPAAAQQPAQPPAQYAQPAAAQQPAQPPAQYAQPQPAQQGYGYAQAGYQQQAYQPQPDVSLYASDIPF